MNIDKPSPDKNSEHLESKIWYRFLKVIYIVTYILIVGYSGLFVSKYLPVEKVEYEKSIIVCGNGERYLANDNDIVIDQKTLDSLRDTQSRILCRFGENTITISHLIKSENYDLSEINYSVETPTKIIGSWGEVIKKEIIALFFIIVTFELIKRIFFYIVIGSPLFIKKSKLKKRSVAK